MSHKIIFIIFVTICSAVMISSFKNRIDNQWTKDEEVLIKKYGIYDMTVQDGVMHLIKLLESE